MYQAESIIKGKDDEFTRIQMIAENDSIAEVRKQCPDSLKYLHNIPRAARAEAALREMGIPKLIKKSKKFDRDKQAELKSFYCVLR